MPRRRPGRQSRLARERTLRRPARVARGPADRQVEHQGADREDDRRPDRRPEERVDRQVAAQPVGELQEQRVDDDREQPERQDDQRERQETEDRPDDRVDDAEERRDPDVAPDTAGHREAGQDPRRQRERHGEHCPRDQQRAKHSVRHPILNTLRADGNASRGIAICVEAPRSRACPPAERHAN